MAGNYRKERDMKAFETQMREEDLAYKRKLEEEKYVREHYLRIAAKAREEKVWIFDPLGKEWYTPDEFEATFKLYIKSPEDVYARIKFKDPFEAIVEAHTKTGEFIQRVLDYAKKISSENEVNKKPSQKK
ncbi:hypothetical protein SAMN05421821_105118 [Mucilaginibacter lappiensis]|uniref:Uncharacterized protein n=1 Tax=Mucilaginibacter lappiensis TaxID=354630 RepID=A0ABR6PIV3_9SPHI|nr:hypothetical protein [Mucilaginibacter lappiensis]MBB6109699.1 hypothetical protein [Mucilaginibacter lappiensis]SIR12257.1 hypothetical protein SAMN05421821_105118 [Mucilaginibacter lappiensis]